MKKTREFQNFNQTTATIPRADPKAVNEAMG